MGTADRTKGAARCAECGRALAVWLSDGTVVNPIGSADGCPCGGTEFRVIGRGRSSSGTDRESASPESSHL